MRKTSVMPSITTLRFGIPAAFAYPHRSVLRVPAFFVFRSRRSVTPRARGIDAALADVRCPSRHSMDQWKGRALFTFSARRHLAVQTPHLLRVLLLVHNARILLKHLLAAAVIALVLCSGILFRAAAMQRAAVAPEAHCVFHVIGLFHAPQGGRVVLRSVSVLATAFAPHGAVVFRKGFSGMLRAHHLVVIAVLPPSL
jgi:hypothetical protein